MYDDFAGVYDTLMDDYDYDAWSEHYLSLIRDALGELPARMAECACGTGSLTVRFARKGVNVVGVDLSAAMLRRAEEKARHGVWRLRLSGRICVGSRCRAASARCWRRATA